VNSSRPAGLILHVLDHAFPELSGYAVRSHNLFLALQAKGFAVVAATSSSREKAAVEEEIDGVRYVRLPLRLEGAPQTGRALWSRLVGLGRWLAKEVRRREVALIHAHSPVINALPALWASRRCGVPLVYEVRGFWEDTALDRDLKTRPDSRYRLSRALETATLRRADAVTTISQGLRGDILLRGVPRERVHLAPNGVDSSVFRPQAADAALLTRHQLAGRLVVGFIGYFLAYEGVDELVRGFARMLGKVPETRLLLVGTGPVEALVRSEAERLGITTRVIFAGAVPHAEISRYYSVCDVVVYPRPSRRSTELTTPLKPLEAMAMEKTVIASSVGGLRELVRDGETGLLYPPGDEERLGEVLAAVAIDPALRARLGAGARRFVCSERTWERAVESYSEVYDVLLRGSRSPVR